MPPTLHLLLGALTAGICSSCNVVSPPPLSPHLAPTAPDAPGDVRIMFVLGLGGGIWVDGGIGGELRVESQVNEWATVGGGLSGALNLEHEESGSGPNRHARHNHPRWLYGVRTWGRFNPGELDWFALKAGLGFTGTNMGTVAFTLDGATLFGGPIEIEGDAGSEPFLLNPYGGPVVALSVPLRQGETIMKPHVSLGLGPDMRTTSRLVPVEFTPTFYVGALGGLAATAPGAPAWTGALEILTLMGFSQTDAAALFAIATGQGVRVRP